MINTKTQDDKILKPQDHSARMSSTRNRERSNRVTLPTEKDILRILDKPRNRTTEEDDAST